jgi:HK97 gp10 family phage protein
VSAHVDFDDKAFLRALNESTDKLDAAAEQVAVQVGRQIASAMRAVAPDRTGRLKRSIKSTPGRDAHGPSADVSVGVFYASFVEFGTSIRRAEPFFRPTMEQADEAVRTKAVRIRP